MKVAHRTCVRGDHFKRLAIHKILKERGIRQAFIFSNSKLGCARLTRTLERDGLRATALHGDKSQDERLKALEAFKAGNVDLLVCTDVAARGLDIKDVPAVFNYDVPFNAEDYVHRIGRTGRAGASGLAVTLVSSRDARQVGEIEKLIKKKIDVEALQLEQPRQQGRMNDGRRAWRGEGEDSARGVVGRPAPSPRSTRPASRPAADPFFDRPYVASAAAPSATWDDTRQPAARPSIKSKRKVAALFRAPELAES